jgi:MOSC domain-containing protein YiiM
MIVLGPYRFTDTDAERTVAALPRLWQWLGEGRDTAAIDGLRPTDAALAEPVKAALPAVWSALLAAGPALRAAGQLPAAASGSVTGLHLSKGGVPKQPIDRVEVDFGGVVGDKQGTRQHHGRPWQALCLWSQEVIDAFAADGHPIAAGFAGENITVCGFDWADVRPGVRLQVGSVLCEVSAYAIPCRHNAPWFSDGDFNRMHSDRGPVSRIYATVLQPGRITVGDAVVLEPSR